MSYYVETPLNSLLVFLGAKSLRFEFTTGTSLNLCIALLNDKERKRGVAGFLLNRSSINVDVNQIDETTYYFRILKMQRSAGHIVVTGYMEQESDTATLIRGSIQTLDLLWRAVVAVLLVALFVALGFMTQSPFPENMSLAGFIAFILIINLYFSASERRGLLFLIQKAVSQDRY